MNVRTTIILAVLVGLVGGFYYWSERQPIPEAGNPKLLGVDEPAIQELSVSHDGTAFSLARSGDGWQLTQPVNAKTDRGPVASLVSSLASARIERTVEEKAADLAAFGLDPPALSITITAKDRSQPVTVLLGKTNPTGSWVYAKIASSPAVLMVSASLKGDLAKTPTDLRDKSIIALDPMKATRLELKARDTLIVATKSGDEWWLERPLKTRADSFAIDRLVGIVRDLRAKDFVAEEASDLAQYGLTRPDYRVSVSEKDGATPKTVLIARKVGAGEKISKAAKAAAPAPESGDAYAAVEGGSQVFLVEGRVLEDLRKSPLDLRDKRLLPFEIKEVKGIRLVWPDVTIALEKDGDAWTLKEPQAAPAESGRAMDLLYMLNGLRFKDIAAEKAGDLSKFGLAKPQAEILVRKTDNTDLPAIEIGKLDKDKGQLFARIRNSPTVYVMEPRILDDLPRDPAKLKREPPQEKKG